jgi:hypothetical protein
MKSGMESKTSSPEVIGIDIGKDVLHPWGLAPTGRLPSAGGSGDWLSKTLLRSCRRASSAWKLA